MSFLGKQNKLAVLLKRSICFFKAKITNISETMWTNFHFQVFPQKFPTNLTHTNIMCGGLVGSGYLIVDIIARTTQDVRTIFEFYIKIMACFYNVMTVFWGNENHLRCKR